MANSAEFKLRVTRALADQMASALDVLTPEPLTKEALAALAQRPGVYQPYHQSSLVYVGKADQSLTQRLERHRFKLGGPMNIELAEVASETTTRANNGTLLELRRTISTHSIRRAWTSS